MAKKENYCEKRYCCKNAFNGVKCNAFKEEKEFKDCKNFVEN